MKINSLMCFLLHFYGGIFTQLSLYATEKFLHFAAQLTQYKYGFNAICLNGRRERKFFIAFVLQSNIALFTQFSSLIDFSPASFLTTMEMENYLEKLGILHYLTLMLTALRDVFIVQMQLMNQLYKRVQQPSVDVLSCTSHKLLQIFLC